MRGTARAAAVAAAAGAPAWAVVAGLAMGAAAAAVARRWRAPLIATQSRALSSDSCRARDLLWLGCLAAVPSLAQRAYPSADAAAQAFADALARNDSEALRTVLGADWKRFVPTSSVDPEDIHDFLAAWDSSTRSCVDGSGTGPLLAVGDGGWTLPIPIVKSGAGWRFDPRAGADEMRTRRIGRNELAAMQAALAYFDAQKEYAQKDRDGNGVLEYAQKFASTPGKHDGLYWPDATGPGPESAGTAVPPARKAGEGYHGYHFKILTAQGKDAPGGAYDYVIGGRMRGGFALVAWPVRYGDTGVTSFMVSHDGVLYEKDLGPGSAAAARGMKRFNPDASWRKVARAWELTMTKFALLFLLSNIAVLLQGCASSHVIPVAKLQDTVACRNEVPQRDVLVGVALSGGGSRAALFGASGLEALAGVRTPQGKSLLESVAHVSSVSGGSLAASSFVLSKPPASVPVLDARGALSPEYKAFFEQYRGKLSQDFRVRWSRAN